MHCCCQTTEQNHAKLPIKNQKNAQALAYVQIFVVPSARPYLHSKQGILRRSYRIVVRIAMIYR